MRIDLKYPAILSALVQAAATFAAGRPITTTVGGSAGELPSSSAGTTDTTDMMTNTPTTNALLKRARKLERGRHRRPPVRPGEPDVAFKAASDPATEPAAASQKINTPNETQTLIGSSSQTLMDYEFVSKGDLVDALLLDASTVEIRNILASSHIRQCAALFTNGQSMGTLYRKDPDTQQPIACSDDTDDLCYEGYMLTDPPVPIVPNEGIILSSGNPSHFNWNNADDQTTDHGAGGDWDLKKSVDESNGWNNGVFDACVLQFEFRCKNEAYIPGVQFSYIWGSEEYYEYVDSAFNDVFGFYLNGENIARVPTTDTDSDLVSINNVNFNKNAKYFHGNDPGTGWDEPSSINAPDTIVYYPKVEADGFTDVLQARGTPFQDESKWNTIKLAVGDVGDHILDSWVLLQGASFACVDITEAPSIAPSMVPSDMPSTSSRPTKSPSMSPSTSTNPTNVPSDQPTVSAAPSFQPSDSPSISSSPSQGPTELPSISSQPTDEPSMSPSFSSAPSLGPSSSPSTSSSPSNQPSDAPSTSSGPTESPSTSPSVSSSPSQEPSSSPTSSAQPSSQPSEQPTISHAPAGGPSASPSISTKPSHQPTNLPSVSDWPTSQPSDSPSVTSQPSSTPTESPSTSVAPTLTPTEQPSLSTAPSLQPSMGPSVSSRPSLEPSLPPSTSSRPSESPSMSPSDTSSPTTRPSGAPSTSSMPTESPSTSPSLSSNPSLEPSMSPTISAQPSVQASEHPSISHAPAGGPSVSPSTSTKPSSLPSEHPSVTHWPTSQPSMSPSITSQPSSLPSEAPSTSATPTLTPTEQPSLSTAPSLHPSDSPSSSTRPSMSLSNSPSSSRSPSTAPTALGSIGPNTVFYDLDEDGVQGPYEPPHAGVAVALYCLDSEDGEYALIEEVVTDSTGQYEFTNVEPASCYIDVAPEVSGNDNYVFSPVPSHEECSEGVCNSIGPDGNSPVVEIDYNDNVDDWDVGMYLPLADIGPNIVWNDLDADGVQDENEDLLAGVAVTLNCDGTEVASTTTNAQGVYEFTDVNPGDCYVSVTAEVDGNDNYSFSPVPSPEDCIDVGCNHIDAEGNSPTVTIGYNDTIDTWDVGMHLPLSGIGPNVVFNDLDHDGVHDEDEPPMIGVPITLNCDGELHITTTNLEGIYEFTDIVPGECFIQVSPQPDFVFSPVPPPQDCADVGCNQIGPDGTSPTIMLNYNATIDTWDVGMYQPPATIGPNVVFQDDDGDGQRDPLEQPLENVAVDLYCYLEDGTVELLGTVNTDTNGEYVFNNVQPGACYIAVDPCEDCLFSPIVPNGNQIYPNGTSPTVDVDWNDVIDDWHVGIFVGVVIGNKVWDDLNGNGVQDEGESGMSNVEVALIDSDNGGVVDAMVTDGEGNYWFTGVSPGEYSVQFTAPSGYEFSPAPSQLVSDQINAIIEAPEIAVDITTLPVPGEDIGATPTMTVTSGENRSEFDTGLYIPVQVTGEVFDDLNGNGIKDSGEPPILGATISVFNNDGDAFADYVVSDEDGLYSLYLPPGEYWANIMPSLPEYTLSPLVEGGNDFDPETMQNQPVLLASGESGAGSFDAGFYKPVSISSFVFDDDNANGILDPQEGGYDGPMTVNLYLASDPNGTPVVSTTTNPSDGSFTLPQVAPGEYEIEFLPSGDEHVSFSPQDQGADDTKDSDVDPTTGRATLTVTSGEDITNITAGVTSLPSIGPNAIFQDDDGDGVHDQGEPGLPGVVVVLYNSQGDQVGDPAITDVNGNYQFYGLEPGDYLIQVNNDPNFEFSPVAPGGNQVSHDPNAEYGNSSPIISLDLGDNDASLIVGMYEPVILGNKVWDDLNGNGILDETEPGMDGITATLRDAYGATLNTTTTDANGYYLFQGLPPGGYAVHFSKPDEYIFTVQAKTSSSITYPVPPDQSLHYDDVTSDVDRETGATNVKYLKSGDENWSFDAGMFIPVTINGTTWHDLNANGNEEDGEPPMQDVIIALFDHDGDYVDSKITSADGVWTFADMPPGTYSVMATPPMNDPPFMLSPRPDSIGNATGKTADFDHETWQTDEIYLQGGESADGYMDAGLYVPATVGDRIWFDDLPNGLQDADEESFNQPVSIRLYDSLGYLVQETQSNEAGSYQFTGLRPGTYDIEFILPEQEEYQFTVPNVGNDTSLDSDVSPTTGRVSVTLISGEQNNNIDAGVMDYGPYYPEWTNDVQVCTNDGFDPSWLEIQEDNYLYRNKEECCKTHFWWRMTQCMANEEFKFYQNGEICDTKIDFEDWESNSGELVTSWTDTTLFNTLEECCANKFWFDFDGCVGRSPVVFKFEFCVDIQGLVDPQDCQSADIYGNVLEYAVNEGCHHHHGLNEDHDDNLEEGEGDHDSSIDANITKIGDATLQKVDGSSVCGGSLGGQGFVNDLTGTMPDTSVVADTVSTICGVISVEEQDCHKEDCLREHYQDIVDELEEFVNSGDLTLAIQRRSIERLPPVPELQVVAALPSTLSTSNLVLPATITGDLNFQYYHGSSLDTCMEKAVFQETEIPYENLVDCCNVHFQWDIEGCCAKGGGCPELRIAGVEEIVNEEGDVVQYFPTWKAGQLCDSKTNFESWETERYATLDACCEAHFPGDSNCI